MINVSWGPLGISVMVRLVETEIRLCARGPSAFRRRFGWRRPAGSEKCRNTESAFHNSNLPGKGSWLRPRCVDREGTGDSLGECPVDGGGKGGGCKC